MSWGSGDRQVPRSLDQASLSMQVSDPSMERTQQHQGGVHNKGSRSLIYLGHRIMLNVILETFELNV